MKKIYSLVDEKKLLHIILRSKEVTTERLNVVDDEQFLQLAAMRLPKGKTFRPHKHVICPKVTNIAQESWAVMKGSVKAILYDINDVIIAEEVLYSGDCSITLYGGHTYEILEDDTLIFEYKTGPYLGAEKDKKEIIEK